MKKFIYFLAAIMALTVTSCKDDDTTFNITEDLDRLPMPMFRRKFNTNIAEENDLYASRLVEGYRNRIQLHWNGVNGAAGYEIRYQVSANAKENEDQWQGDDVTYVRNIPADQLSLVLTDLDYSTPYLFSIRALHPDGKEEHHSKWYGMGSGRQWEDYLSITTSERYTVPGVLAVRDKDFDGFSIIINPTYDRSKYDTQDADTIEKHFRLVDGNKFPFDELSVECSSLNPNAEVNPDFVNKKISLDDCVIEDDGFIHIKVNGLSSNASYIVKLRDSQNPFADGLVDQYYNYGTIRTKGEVGDPVKIVHKVGTEYWYHPNADNREIEEKYLEYEKQYQACCIDSVFYDFSGNFKLAEGQTFYLEGGKTYYIRQNIDVNKGFTLTTDPEDLAAGKGRARLLMSGLFRNSVGECVGSMGANFMLGKEKTPTDVDAPVLVEKVVLDNIDFDCPMALNYGTSQTTGVGATGNYIVNMYAKGLPIEFEAFEMRNCTFQNIIRGFFRIQGAKSRIINHLIIDNNVFANCGYYGAGGGGFGFIHGASETSEENICGDLRVINNTFYDAPIAPIKPNNNNKVHKDDFAPNVHWNIEIANNTFINWGTRSDKQYIFQSQEMPGGSKITFKNNLICLAAADDDRRDLYCSGIFVRNIHGSGEVSFDIHDNYSTGCREKHLKDDGIFSNGRISAEKDAPGKWSEKDLCGNTMEDLKVKVGSVPLLTTDVFNDPNPQHHAASANEAKPDTHACKLEDLWTRLAYKTSGKLLDHEIYIKNIGAPRWRSADPKNFTIQSSSVN